MGKGKMTLIDVRAEVKELQKKIVGLRLANIYNLNPKTYLFKFSSSDMKEHLLIESGVRIHCTQYSRDKDKIPSNFAVKLRKHLRTKRLESIQQVGVDRVIDMQFGAGGTAYHVLLELYAQGNIILTDANYTILLVLRTFSHQKGHEEDKEESKPSAESIEGDEKEDTNAQQSTGEDRIAVREQYPMQRTQQEIQTVTVDSLKQVITKQIQKATEEHTQQQSKQEDKQKPQEESITDNAEAEEGVNLQGKHLRKQRELEKQKRIEQYQQQKKEKYKIKIPPLKAVLAQYFFYGPDLIEHCCIQAGLNPNLSIHSLQEITEQQLQKLSATLNEAQQLLDRLSTETLPGYIVVKQEQGKSKKQQQQQAQQKKKEQRRKQKGGKQGEEEGEDDENDEEINNLIQQTQDQLEVQANEQQTTTDTATSQSTEDNSHSSTQPNNSTSSTNNASTTSISLYSEYLPLLLAQHSLPPYTSPDTQIISFTSMNEAMDEYYSQLEEQKEQVRVMKLKQDVLATVEREKQRHEKQLNALHQVQETTERQAQLIEMNLLAVDQTIAAINTELAKGMDWRELNTLIKEEKKKRNPVAMLIHSMNFQENEITINLSENLMHLNPAFASNPQYRPVRVTLNLSLTAHLNAAQYYQQKKKSAHKAHKAEAAGEKAIKAAERKTQQQLKDVDIKQKIQKIRKIHWFEKFYWFISSENYLVIGGKDAQQNESIVKKHLGRDDIYIHADAHGAPSVIVKNHHPGTPVPLHTLSEAGTMTISRSAAWKSKIQVESYWVYADQVSKTPPTGLYLATGSFMIRGKKNYLPRLPLIMGIALLFRVDDEHVGRHVGERKVKGTAGEAEENGETSDSKPKRPLRDETPTETASTTQPSQPLQPTQPIRQSSIHDEEDVTSSLVFSAATTKPNKPLQPIILSDEELSESDSKSKNRDSSNKVKAENAKKKLSAAERRRMKKGGATGPKEDEHSDEKQEEKQEETHGKADEKDNDEEKPSKSKSTEDKKKSTDNKAKQQPLTRAQRSKLKKREKYAEQDEEDLLVAAQRMGLKVDAKKGGQKGKKKNQNESDSDSEISIDGAVLDKFTKKRGNKPDEEETGKKGGKSGKDKPQQKGGKQQEQKGGKPEAKGKDDGKAKSKPAENSNDAQLSSPIAQPTETTLTTATATETVTQPTGEKNHESDDHSAETSNASDDDDDTADKVCYACKQRGHIFKHCPTRGTDQSTYSAARRAVLDAEAAEIQQLIAEENIHTGDDVSAMVSELDSLTGRPLPDDLLHYCIPVCAPYSAISDYKFKAKLIPGTAKRGKVGQQAVALFSKQDAVTVLEKDLIKSIPENDVLTVLVSNVKLSAPGMNVEGKKRRTGKVRHQQCLYTSY